VKRSNEATKRRSDGATEGREEEDVSFPPFVAPSLLPLPGFPANAATATIYCATPRGRIMGLSRIRADLPQPGNDLASPPEGDLKPYEVFVQVERGKPHSHAGSVDASDDQMALLFAREHFGRDQECVQIWVVPRHAIIRTDYEKDMVFRLSDQSYRFAKGYNVGEKWRKFMSQKEYDSYKGGDIKEHF
jgi:ring-1,2-phenylacetyl-CoA epoxidase subunit PaaB